ncbi:MAG: hypothetical protein K0R92_3645 [Lachnospiraceae bacterium]|jgi:uncharacterized protein|nr:hypothetical protein [Lachnospiraceae bacterium]
MRLSDKEKKDFINHIHEFLLQEQVHEMKKYIQHGKTTTFTHCIIVAYYSYCIALRLPMKLDAKSVARGAFLHDFYLYDWHIPDKSHKLHGFVHPGFALTNARKYFILNSKEEDIIEKHMWPLTLYRFPRSYESFIVCLVDKFCSLAETLYIPVIPCDYKNIHQLISLRKVIY